MSSHYPTCLHLGLVPEELTFSASEVTPQWHLCGLDSKVIFKFRKCGTEIKKELSGTVEKQTQTEQAYPFSRRKIDDISKSKSMHNIMGWGLSNRERCSP